MAITLKIEPEHQSPIAQRALSQCKSKSRYAREAIDFYAQFGTVLSQLQSDMQAIRSAIGIGNTDTDMAAILVQDGSGVRRTEVTATAKKEKKEKKEEKIIGRGEDQYVAPQTDTTTVNMIDQPHSPTPAPEKHKTHQNMQKQQTHQKQETQQNNDIMRGAMALFGADDDD